MLRLLLCVMVSVVVGIGCGGWSALKMRSAGNVTGAAWALHRGSLVASISSLVLLLILFGWPWKPQTVNVLEEFSENVIVPEEGAVAAIKSGFARLSAWWTGTQAVLPTTTKTVTGKRTVPHTEKHFSPWLLVGELLIAAAAYYAQLRACAFLWRVTPRKLRMSH